MTSGVIKELQKYAATHFAHEEAYMEKIKDPELLRQKKEHTEFTSRVSQMTEDNTDMEYIGYDGLEAQKRAHQAFVDRLADKPYQAGG